MNTTWCCAMMTWNKMKRVNELNLKRLCSMVLILVLAFAFVGCTSKADSVEDTNNGEVEATAETSPAKDETASDEGAELEDTVVIYTTHSEAMLEVVADAFEEETGVKVEFLNFKGELPERVRAEKGNPQADVMYGAASSVFIDLQNDDLFEAYEPSWAADINPLFRDPDGYWHGTIQTPVMLFYNNEMISEEEAPKDWFDLTDAAYQDQLVFRNALSSSARATFSSLIYQFEKEGNMDDGWAFMKALDANTKQYYGSGSLQFQAVGRQEAAISFATLNSIVDNQINNNMPLTIVDAESGSPVITDSIAMIKDAPHPNAAKAFIEFAGSPEIQALLANEFNRMPTHPEAIANSPEWMGEMTFEIMDVDWAILSEKQSEWMQTWDSEIKDTGKDPQ